MGRADADALARQAARLMGVGDYEGSLEAFRASHALRPDPAVEDRVRRLEAYLRVRPGVPVGPAGTTPSNTPPAVAITPRTQPAARTSARPPSEPMARDPHAPVTPAPDGLEVPGFGRRGLNDEGSRLRPPAPDAPLAPTRAPPSGQPPGLDLDDESLTPDEIATPEEESKAKQQLAEEVLRAVPKVGTALDILLLARGESLSGDKLTWGQAGMMVGFRALMVLGPAGAKGLYNRAMNTENGRLFFQALGEMGPNMGASGVRGLARVFGTSEKQVRDIFSWAGDQMTRERTLRGGVNGLFGRQAQAAGRNFVPLRAGQAAIHQQRIERRHAERLLDRMAGTTDRREFRRLAVQLQANKTAQAVINTPRYSDALRLKAERSRAAMGRLADRHTADEILRMTPRENGLERVLRNNPALNREDVIVRARTITTHRAGQGPVSFGRDRDVWFEFVDRRTGQRLGDIHHDVSRPVYSSHLRRITGRDAESLDHAVTSWWHPDAYATGRYTADSHGRAALVIGSGRRAGNLQRARDVSDTARYKPKEWFDPPRDAQGRVRPMGPMEQNQRIREGMRQTVKEYDRHVAPYLRAQGVGPDRLPPRLRQGLDIFRDVQQGVLDDRMTPEQALRMLQALPGNATPQTIADDLAQLVQFINIWGL